MRLPLFILSLLLFSQATLSSQTVRNDTLRLPVSFRSRESVIDPKYGNNPATIDRLVGALEAGLADPSARIGIISIRTGSTPDGATDVNKRISEERAESIRRLILGRVSGSERLRFKVTAVGEDWERLAAMIDEYDEPWSKEASSLIRNTPLWIKEGGVVTDGRKNRLKKLRHGEVWKYLLDNIFPAMRMEAGEVTCVVPRTVADKPAEPVAEKSVEAVVEKPVEAVVEKQVETVVEKPAEPVAEKKPSEPVADKKPGSGVQEVPVDKTVFALRTNFLMVPLANLGVEIPLSDRWSLGADLYYPWVPRMDHYDWCVQLAAAGLEARYWFRHKPKGGKDGRLLGHSFGLFGAAGMFDLEWDSKGRQGEFAAAGIDYLFACPIFRNRMHLEFEAGFGAIYSPHDIYSSIRLQDKPVLWKEGESNLLWLGPVKAGISLVVPIRSRR